MNVHQEALHLLILIDVAMTFCSRKGGVMRGLCTQLQAPAAINMLQCLARFNVVPTP